MEQSAQRSRIAKRMSATLVAAVTLVGAAPATALGSSSRAPAAAATAAPTPATRVTQCPYTAHDLRRLDVLRRESGRDIHCALVFSDNMQTWAQWERPWFAYSPHAQHKWEEWVRASKGRNRLVMTFNLIPKSTPADWRARGARGEYDAHARRLAQNLVSRGLGDQVVRLGAEANGDWRIDQIGDTVEQRRDWARYWARVVRVMRTVPGARFTFDWCVNGGYRPIPFTQYYPGDDVVDVISMDQYDSVTRQRTTDRFTEISRQRGGLLELAAFAKAHRKPIGLPEVGLVSRANHGAGDNPAYVQGLARFVSTHPTAYVGYFDHQANGVLRLQDVPRSAASWKRSFGDGTTLDAVIRTTTACVPARPAR